MGRMLLILSEGQACLSPQQEQMNCDITAAWPVFLYHNGSQPS